MFYVCMYVSDQLGRFLWERVNAGFSLASGFVTPTSRFFLTDLEVKLGSVFCGMVTMNASGAALKLKGWLGRSWFDLSCLYCPTKLPTNKWDHIYIGLGTQNCPTKGGVAMWGASEIMALPERGGWGVGPMPRFSGGFGKVYKGQI